MFWQRLVLCVTASMNNLNDPPRWNIQPDPRGRGVGAGDGNQWNYALLVPMLGLAAFRKLHKVSVSVNETARLKFEVCLFA